jgi:Tol biopolymer transport system component
MTPERRDDWSAHVLRRGFDGVSAQPNTDDLARRVEARERARRRSALITGGGVGALVFALVIAGVLQHRANDFPRSVADAGIVSTSSGVDGAKIPEGGWLLAIDGGAEFVNSSGTDDTYNDIAPYTVSPDGTKLAATTTERIEYSSPGNENYSAVTRQPELLLIDLTTGARTVLVKEDDMATIDGPVSWSPDSSAIAYRSTIWSVDPHAEHPADRVKLQTVCVAGVDSGDNTCYPKATDVTWFEWDPSGQHLIIAESAPATVDVLGLTNEAFDVVVPEGGTASIRDAMSSSGYGDVISVTQPMWSPSGRFIGATVQTSSGGSVPIVMTPEGSVVAVGQNNADFQTLAWSPIDDVLAYSTGVQIETDSTKDNFAVYLLTPKTTTSERLMTITGSDALVASLVWSPDGHYLAVDGSEDQHTDTIRIVDVDAATVSEVVVNSDAAAALLDWSV